MAQESTQSPSTLNVLIFKDDLKARTFRIPLGWFASFGTLLLVLVSLFFSASFFAIKFYRMNLKMDPTRMIELEREVKDLKLVNSELKQEIDIKNGTPVATTTPATGATTEPQIDPNPKALVPEVNESLISSSSVALFHAFDPRTRLLSKDGAIPIRIDRFTAGWSKDTLQVDFNILYAAQDNGSQQGHIVVIARGGSYFLGHPDLVLNPTTEGYLINPDRGEYFSVSRFRATSVSFPGISPRSKIKQVQVYLFNKENNIILSEAITVNPNKIATPPAPPPVMQQAPPAAQPQPLQQPQAAPTSDAAQPQETPGATSPTPKSYPRDTK